MTGPIVVGVDGSDAALVALDWAADAARRLGLPLRAVYASLWERYEGAAPASFGSARPEDAALADWIVGSTEARVHAHSPGLRVKAVALPQDAGAALVAESRGAALVVTGVSGRGLITERLLGSVSLTLAGGAHCPSVVVRGEQPNVQGLYRRVVVGVHDPAQARPALRYALREAAARRCELQVVHAWRRVAQEPVDHMGVPGDTMGAQRDRAVHLLAEAVGIVVGGGGDVAVRRTAVEGPAHRVLTGLSTEADLLVIGASHREHHHDQRRGPRVGHVAHAVLHRAACPVAIVHETG
ncbi:universal stress protein [Streptomyces sp. NPDC020412]|uniref:universal stress protein n=1 Tax=Streptomyces sp. NPDC020412 TaxID=3365073 RepID=UPI00379EBB41